MVSNLTNPETVQSFFFTLILVQFDGVEAPHRHAQMNKVNFALIKGYIPTLL